MPHRLRQSEPHRFVALLWWLVLLTTTGVIIGFWALFAQEPDLLSFGIALLITIGVGWSIRHEWPHAARMAKMLITGD